MSRDRLKSSVQALEDARFELIPIKGASEQASYLSESAQVPITCSPKLGIETTLALGEDLARRGFWAIPHVSARLVEGEEHLKNILRRMDDHRMREIFVVGGDVEEPGPFPSALKLLEAMSRLEHGVERVGITSYPEPHPLISDEELTEALHSKAPFASYMVTQICFEPEVILDWVAKIRQQEGITLPVYVGLPGAIDQRKLLQISAKIGVGDSIRFLRKQSGLMRLIKPGGYKPDKLIKALAPYVGDDHYNIRGFHLNTFNQVGNTERWRERMLDRL